MADTVETRQEKKERKERERQERERERQERERERQEKEKQERERKERERLEKQEKERKKKEEKEMKRRGRNTSSASDISSPPHQLTSPTTDDDYPIPPGSTWAVLGGGTTSHTGTGRLRPVVKAIHEPMIKQPRDSYSVTDDRQRIISTAERGQIQAIKESPLVPIKTSPSSTDNTLMTEYYNDEPTRAGATNITISPHVHVDQSMMMTGSYDRLEPSTDMVPSGSVTTRPVIGPIQGHHLHTSHDDTASPQSLPDINSIDTRLYIAELERDEYKKDLEKRERELKQRQEEIVQLKVEIRKIQSNSHQTHPQPSHLINEKMREELEQKMREELAAKEQKMREELAAKEQKMREELLAKEQEVDELKRGTETLAREKEDLKREKDEITAEAADNVAAKEKEMEEKLTAQLLEVDREKQKMENEREELKRQISISDRLVAENEELKGRLLAYERDGQGSHQYGHESLSQQRNSAAQIIAKYKMKLRELHEELMMKEKHMMELNEKLTKRNEIVTKLNDKLTKMNDENKRLHMSMVVIDEKSKADQTRAESDRDGVKRQITDAYNEIKRLADQIHGLNEEIETMKQEHVNEKEGLLMTINDQSNTIKQHVEVGDEMMGKLTHQHLLVEEKEELITRLMNEIEEKNNTIDEFRQQVAKVVEQNNQSTQNVNEKQLVIGQKELALKEQLEIAKVQLQEYADGFNNERKDRERMGSELDDKRCEVLALQQSLHDEAHKTKELEAKNHSLQQIVQQQKNELSVKDEAARDWEEEKMILTTQVNSYARQGDELKKSLTEQTDKCKMLEDQLMKKTKIDENEVDKLRQDLESERNSKQHLVSAFNQGKVKVTVLEQEKMKLEGVIKMGLAENAQLQQFIAQEQARLENEMARTKNANKTIKENLLKLRQQLQEKTSEYDRLKEDYDSLTKLYQTWKVDRDEINMTREELGSGGWAVVNVAYFRGTRVAAKCLHKMIISDFNRGVFIREINIAATIRHPNLVQFIGATLVGSPIILSELMPTSLRKELERGRLTQPQIIKISSDVCCGLNYLHLFQPSPIVHRDVSDANVLLEPSGGAGEWKAKVSDYGSANLIQQITATSVMPGAFSYAAPEAETPSRHSPAMDVYSFGILVMVMILHMPPSTTVGERETQSNTIKWPPMRSLVQKCINHDHQRRPSIGDIHRSITSL